MAHSFKLIFIWITFLVLMRAVPKLWVATQTWVAKGRKVAPRWFNSANTNFFFSFFKFFQFCHRLNYCIASYAFHLASYSSYYCMDYCIISGFPRVLLAAQLLAVNSVVKLLLAVRILELNSSLNRSVEYQSW